MTPIQGRNISDAEEKYNRHHRKARNCIERCFGVLKSRFRCLSKERVLMYSPVLAGKIIISCIVLHNFLIENHVTDFEFFDTIGQMPDEHQNNSDEVMPQGRIARQQKVENYLTF